MNIDRGGVIIDGKIKRQAVSILKIVLGNILLTATYAFLTVPNNIINGGVTSFSLALSTATGIDIAVFSNGITIFLIVFSAFAISREFCVKSLLSSILYMGFFTLFHLTGFAIHLPQIAVAVVAGALVGLSYFLCIDADSSTAGFDVASIAINKHFPKTNVAINLRIISIIVLVIGASVLGIWAVLFGILFTLVETGVLKVAMAWSAKRRRAQAEPGTRVEPLIDEGIV